MKYLDNKQTTLTHYTKAAIEELPFAEREIIEYHFGFKHGNCDTLRQLSQVQVSFFEQDALRALRRICLRVH